MKKSRWILGAAVAAIAALAMACGNGDDTPPPPPPTDAQAAQNALNAAPTGTWTVFVPWLEEPIGTPVSAEDVLDEVEGVVAYRIGNLLDVGTLNVYDWGFYWVDRPEGAGLPTSEVGLPAGNRTFAVFIEGDDESEVEFNLTVNVEISAAPADDAERGYNAIRAALWTPVSIVWQGSAGDTANAALDNVQAQVDAALLGVPATATAEWAAAPTPTNANIAAAPFVFNVAIVGDDTETGSIDITVSVAFTEFVSALISDLVSISGYGDPTLPAWGSDVVLPGDALAAPFSIMGPATTTAEWHIPTTGNPSLRITGRTHNHQRLAFALAGLGLEERDTITITGRGIAQVAPSNERRMNIVTFVGEAGSQAEEGDQIAPAGGTVNYSFTWMVPMGDGLGAVTAVGIGTTSWGAVNVDDNQANYIDTFYIDSIAIVRAEPLQFGDPVFDMASLNEVQALAHFAGRGNVNRSELSWDDAGATPVVVAAIGGSGTGLHDAAGHDWSPLRILPPNLAGIFENYKLEVTIVASQALAGNGTFGLRPAGAGGAPPIALDVAGTTLTGTHILTAAQVISGLEFAFNMWGGLNPVPAGFTFTVTEMRVIELVD